MKLLCKTFTQTLYYLNTSWVPNVAKLAVILETIVPTGRLLADRAGGNVLCIWKKSCFWFQLFVSMLQIFSIKKNSSESYLSGQNHVSCLLHYSDATTQLITPCVVLAISSVEYISTFCFKKNKNFLAQKAKKKSVWRVSLKQEISFKENSFKVRNIFK